MLVLVDVGGYTLTDLGQSLFLRLSLLLGLGECVSTEPFILDEVLDERWLQSEALRNLKLADSILECQRRDLPKLPGAELSLRKPLPLPHARLRFEAKHQVLLLSLRKLSLAPSVQLGHHEVSGLVSDSRLAAGRFSCSLGPLLEPLPQLSCKLCVLPQSFFGQSVGLDGEGLGLPLEVVWVEDEHAPIMVELSPDGLLGPVKLKVFLAVEDHELLRADLLE